MNPFSYSTLSKFHDCDYKGYLYHIVGLRPREIRQDDHHSLYGIAFAAALETFYKSGLKNDDHSTRNVLQVFESSFIGLNSSERAKTLENGKIALARYIAKYSELDKEYEILEVEQGDYTDDGLIVHPDLIVRQKSNGNVYGVDHKVSGKYETDGGARKGSSGYLGQDWFAKYENSHQIGIYARYIREKYGQCAGFIINAIGLVWTEKPKLFRIGDDEASAYSNVIGRKSETSYQKKNYGGYHLAATGLRVNFARHTFEAGKEQIENVEISTDGKINQIYRAAKALELGVEILYAFPQNDGHCWKCEYSPACRPGYVWPTHSEVIQNHCKLVCNEIVPETLRPCLHEPGHQGEHSSDRVIESPVFNINIDDMDIDFSEREI